MTRIFPLCVIPRLLRPSNPNITDNIYIIFLPVALLSYLGIKTIEGCLALQGVRVQRARLRSSLKRAESDPVGQRLRSNS